MVSSAIFASIFGLLVGFGLLYLGFKRSREMSTPTWFIIATIIFFSLSLQTMGLQAPILSGISLIFFFVSFLFSIKEAFDVVKSRI